MKETRAFLDYGSDFVEASAAAFDDMHEARTSITPFVCEEFVALLLVACSAEAEQAVSCDTLGAA